MPNSREQSLIDLQTQFGTILNCVTHAWTSSYSVSADEYVLVSHNRSDPKSSMLKMKKGRESYAIQAHQRIKILDGHDFKVTTLKYFYIIWQPAKNERVIDWHYHRRKNDSFESHLHVRDDMHLTNHYLVDKHLPTGRVALEDVIRFAIEEIGIQPRDDNWKALLNQTEAAFKHKRTW